MAPDGVAYVEHTALSVGAALRLVPEHRLFRVFSIDSMLTWHLAVRRQISNSNLRFQLRTAFICVWG